MRESTRLTLLLVVLVASLVWWISQNLLDLDLLSANLSTWLQSVTGYVSPITKNVTNLIDSLFGKLGDRTVWIDYFIKRIIDVVAYVPLALILPLIFFVAGPRRYACWHKLKKVISGRHLDELQDAEEWVNDRYDSAHPSFDFDGRELAEKWSFYGFRTARASPGSTMAQHVASRFHARREQATAILKWVAQHKEGCLHVHVRGDSGDGKSVLLADLAHELRSQSAKNIVLTLKASHGAKAIEDALDWDKLMAYWRLHRPTLWQRWKNSADKQKGSADCFCVILDDFDCRLWKDDGAKEKRNTFLTFHGRLNRKGPKVLLLVTSAETPLNRVKGVLRYPEDRPMDLTEKDERAIFQALVHENPPVLPNLSNLRVEDAWCRGGSVRLHNKNLQAFLDLLFSWDPDTTNSIVVTMMQQLTDQSRDPNTGYTLAATRRAQIYVAACQIVGVAVPHGVLECALRAYVNREGAAHPGNRLEEDFSRLCDPIKIDDSHMLRKYSLYAPRIARTLLPRLGVWSRVIIYPRGAILCSVPARC